MLSPMLCWCGGISEAHLSGDTTSHAELEWCESDRVDRMEGVQMSFFFGLTLRSVSYDGPLISADMFSVRFS